MARDLARYERGQVWWIKGINDAVGHEQQKDRPWLILSVSAFNETSYMITVVPLHTGNVAKTISQVVFTNDYGIKNVILCEHIRSIDYSDKKYTLEYKYTLSSEVMDRVDRALSVHLGLHYSERRIAELEESLNRLCDTVVHLKMERLKEASADSFIEKVTSHLNDKIKELESQLPDTISSDNIVVPKYEEVTLEVAPKVTSSSELGPNVIDPVVEAHNRKVRSKGQKRRRWTVEKADEYLKDCSSLPMKKVMEKWDIQKKSNYYSMKSYCEGILEKATRPTTDS